MAQHARKIKTSCWTGISKDQHKSGGLQPNCNQIAATDHRDPPHRYAAILLAQGRLNATRCYADAIPTLCRCYAVEQHHESIAQNPSFI